jgi:hypothetical protein
LQKSLATELASKLIPQSLRSRKPILKRKVGYNEADVPLATEQTSKVIPQSLSSIKPIFKRKVGYNNAEKVGYNDAKKVGYYDMDVNKAREKLCHMQIDTNDSPARVDDMWTLD